MTSKLHISGSIGSVDSTLVSLEDYDLAILDLLLFKLEV